MAILLPIQSRSVMPWKNGGGSTTEIFVSPVGADLASFDWRISLATIASNGPFSSFPGIDRTLALVSGAGVDLQVTEEGSEYTEHVDLRLGGRDHIIFPGEAQVQADLVDGATTDFNVMTRRARWLHHFRQLDVTSATTWRHRSRFSLLFAAQGSVRCEQEGERESECYTLNTLDAVLLASEDATVWTLQATDPLLAARLFIIEIDATT
ncbi:MAG: HutD family protein [Burkholderiales bacterium]|nr:HutD family protein [Burkholderiales bacterium]